ncbi:unnamed protein product [Penicillium roqueforti FM164]|uniref:Genomic scaffold, ProqFM164S03 n=1 Tax=Penicillium roqueforti (strain FM164) TaxID=1365484 RepID=W6QDH3_PENRF|nr:unnamed protein product [Penicillium roqueforti FM164]
MSVQKIALFQERGEISQNKHTIIRSRAALEPALIHISPSYLLHTPPISEESERGHHSLIAFGSLAKRGYFAASCGG